MEGQTARLRVSFNPAPTPTAHCRRKTAISLFCSLREPIARNVYDGGALGASSANQVILPCWTMSAAIVLSGGAYPSTLRGTPSASDFDIQWDEISRDRTDFHPG